jgi:hypothetical protein
MISPSQGGGLSTDICPNDGVAIGVRATIDAVGNTLLKSIALTCGTVGISGTGPYKLTITMVGQLPPHGDFPGVVMQTPSCPADQVIVGFDSKAAMYVDQISLRCAPLTIVAGDAGYTLSVGTSAPIAAVGGQGGTPQRQVSCPPGTVAAGSVLRAGSYVDAFALACASPVLILAQ